MINALHAQFPEDFPYLKKKKRIIGNSVCSRADAMLIFWLRFLVL